MKNLNLKSINLGPTDVLSRDRMKTVFGGNMPVGGGGTGCATSTVVCTLYIEGIGNRAGNCGVSGTKCVCTTSVNGTAYETNNGGTSCVVPIS